MRPCPSPCRECPDGGRAPAADAGRKQGGRRSVACPCQGFRPYAGAITFFIISLYVNRRIGLL
ncbi:hypothetical protein HMPREF9141_2072 [Prevotella multiformis DSM 16608]|uniref:Uncharacterized protein n=1 Tax=Prevotella multiformis DSM 16608 TaxID=888743 RepID=F0F905_9BACT|nr:hypothetical protein HMPREF9141_2072 [Prevotella multiformis DSM 16608]